MRDEGLLSRLDQQSPGRTPERRRRQRIEHRSSQLSRSRVGAHCAKRPPTGGLSRFYVDKRKPQQDRNALRLRMDPRARRDTGSCATLVEISIPNSGRHYSGANLRYRRAALAGRDQGFEDVGALPDVREHGCGLRKGIRRRRFAGIVVVLGQPRLPLGDALAYCSMIAASSAS
jgi:hypothetical protein